MVLRKCKGCGLEATTEKELVLFRKSNASKYGREHKCKVCSNIERAEDPRQQLHDKKRRAFNKYGITLEQYEVSMATSPCCEICGDSNNLNYDHDHITMCFRGVLCNKCNRALGMLGDTLEGVKKAYEYLQK